MNSRLISGTVSGNLSTICVSCNPTISNRKRETREFGVQPTMQAQTLELSLIHIWRRVAHPFEAVVLPSESPFSAGDEHFRRFSSLSLIHI